MMISFPVTRRKLVLKNHQKAKANKFNKHNTNIELTKYNTLMNPRI
jgi:hypothetical protein